MIIKSIFIVLFGCCTTTLGMAQTLVSLTSGKNTSIRGLSVVNDRIAWVSGSNGWVGVTVDAGEHWSWKQLANYEKLDFRDIEAFSRQKAIVVSAGSPAVILKTVDGGNTWDEVYYNDSPDIFLDGMDFWNERTGLIYGDPIGDEMQVLKTTDAGSTWKNISENTGIPLSPGEASFAASGTNIRTSGGGICWIATGGKRSRIFYSGDYGKNWQAYACPIIQGEASTGPFSIAFKTSKRGVAAGGNYLIDTLRTNNFLLTEDGGKTWKPALINPFGYRSSVEYVTRNMLIATGTSGTDVSHDGGRTWKKLSSSGFHVVRKAKRGKLVLLAGSDGKIARLRR